MLAVAMLVAWGGPAWVQGGWSWITLQGAWGFFYSDTELRSQVTVRPFMQLSGVYPGRPAWRVPREDFSLRIQGWLWVPATAEYEFAARSDDGLRLWIDDRPVLDRWKIQSWQSEKSRGSLRLTRGWHAIRTEFVEYSGQARFRVDWKGGPILVPSRVGGEYLWKVKVPWKK
jgi:mannan endo-1,4-beta-mannosidase